MSVKRFYCEYDDKEAWMGNADSAPADATLYVLASDYDALQSQIAALELHNCTLSESYMTAKRGYDALQSQVEALQNRWASRPLSVEDTTALEKENDALRPDAKRYRYLRTSPFNQHILWCAAPETIDATIDAELERIALATGEKS